MKQVPREGEGQIMKGKEIEQRYAATTTTKDSSQQEEEESCRARP
jgi:hypothetical protein